MKVLKIVLLVVFISLGCLLSGCGETKAEKHLRQGNEYLRYYSQGKYEQAIDEFQKVIKIDPNNLLGHFFLGVCYKLQGELDAADAAAILIADQGNEMVIPNTYTTIGNEAFFNTGLISVEIPNSVTIINKGAFAYTGLASVVIFFR